MGDKEPSEVVFVVGPTRLQNELMASSIEKVAGVRCIPASNLNDLPRLTNASHTTRLGLWDC